MHSTRMILVVFSYLFVVTFAAPPANLSVSLPATLPAKPPANLSSTLPANYSYEIPPEQLPAPESAESNFLGLSSGATRVVNEIRTDFSCAGRAYGYFADVGNRCQIYHICQPFQSSKGKAIYYQYSYFCPENTLFDQRLLTCIDKNNPDITPCSESQSYFPSTELRFNEPYELSKNQPVELRSFSELPQPSIVRFQILPQDIRSAQSLQKQQMVQPINPGIEQPAPVSPIDVSLRSQPAGQQVLPRGQQILQIGPKGNLLMVGFLPKSPEEINTKFLLHTRKNLKDPQCLKVNESESIKNSSFNPAVPTKMILHGFMDNRLFGDWMRRLKDEFLKKGDFNVIIVDWSGRNDSRPQDLLNLPESHDFLRLLCLYEQARINTKVVGDVVAMLINDLKKTTGADVGSFHILGHSLGAHVAGYAGKKLWKETGKKLGRITALGPAGPHFEGLPPEERLDPTDAEFVDVIHTDGRPLRELGFGTQNPMGHIDFYPNGGKNQPGCPFVSATQRNSVTHPIRKLVACEHQRAIELYIESINENSMLPVSYSCSDYEPFLKGQCIDCGDNGEKCALLGDGAEKWKKYKSENKSVKMFMITGENSPFFKNQVLVKIKMSKNHSNQKLNGTMMLTFYSSSGLKFDMSKDELIHQGETYTYFLAVPRDFGDVTKINLKWSIGKYHLYSPTPDNIPLIPHFNIYVDSIIVIPLSTENAMDKIKHEKEMKTFCNKTPGSALKDGFNYEFSVLC